MPELDASDLNHGRGMMRHRLRARLAGERGFTLVEILVVIVLVGILAAIALAVFLNQQDKAHDSSAKSNANNLVHLVLACSEGREDAQDFRRCDSAAEVNADSIPIDPTAAGSADCTDNAALDAVDPGAVDEGKARVALSGQNCFVVIAGSESGNTFWYVKHSDGTVFRNCSILGNNGCPSSGQWAG